MVGLLTYDPSCTDLGGSKVGVISPTTVMTDERNFEPLQCPLAHSQFHKVLGQVDGVIVDLPPAGNMEFSLLQWAFVA